ncbi:hypothetical protein F66182_7571 [Fusarium sp. NRRL 66182]|nr:hypothetical protein F66182_7571 [Fusarium sp. NRRL 66182]
MARCHSKHDSITATSADHVSRASDNSRPRTVDDDVSPAEDETDYSDTTSNYSTISEDTLPLIRAYGHTYHGSGQLITPNDVTEAHSLAVQHELFQLCLDGNLVDAKLPLEQYTPKDPFQILDIGAGSGIWACEMARRYPQVNILGIDLSSNLLPKDVPPNVTFEIADATDPWPARTYDFIHMRNLVGGGIRDWSALVREAYAHLKPGGQLEFTEIQPHFFDVDPEQADLPNSNPEVGTACVEYETTYEELCARFGIDYDPVPKVPGWLNGLGAEFIRQRADWLPVQNWVNDPVTEKKRKTLMEKLDCMENWTLMLFGKAGWEERDTRALIDRVKSEMQDPLLRSAVKVYVPSTDSETAKLTLDRAFITARKPM